MFKAMSAISGQEQRSLGWILEGSMCSDAQCALGMEAEMES